MIISCDYLNLSLANEYVDDVTIPTQVIQYNQNFLQVNQPIRLQYSNQIKLLTNNIAKHSKCGNIIKFNVSKYKKKMVTKFDKKKYIESSYK